MRYAPEKRDFHKNRGDCLRRFAALLTALMMLVSSAPLSALAEGENARLVCGMAEHAHDRQCFPPVLTCGLEETDPITETVRRYTQVFSAQAYGFMPR